MRIGGIMYVYTLPLRSHTDGMLLQQRQLNLTPLQTVTGWLLTLTNSITHQGIWLKAQHYPCGVCSFSSLSWLFKNKMTSDICLGAEEKRLFKRKKRPPRDWAHEHTSAATYTLTKKHSDTQELSLTFMPLNSLLFSASVGGERGRS